MELQPVCSVLGAIDFGLVVDSSVVMIENCVRHLAHNRNGQESSEIIRDAAIEVRKPTMFGELIIMIVYLPILTLEGVEGKLFRPMAMTVILALAGSMVLVADVDACVGKPVSAEEDRRKRTAADSRSEATLCTGSTVYDAP